MKNRWQSRPEPGPGKAQLYWHILMRDQPQVAALAAVARQRLAGFQGLHATPEQWLHLSVLRVGLDSDLPADGVQAMVGQARERLAQVAPVTVTLGPVLYRPEAIALAVGPDGALAGVAAAVRQAARDTLALPGAAPDAPWIPHVTVAYSTLDQPADPIIAALGRELPGGEITVEVASLVAQHGPERAWDWRLLARVPLGAPRPLVTEPGRPGPAGAPGGG
jgi:2'-5' RNA ligase